MVNNDYIEVNGPTSLAELLAAIDPSAPAPVGEAVDVELGGDVYASVQYDAVDADTWPYMVSIESRADDLLPVRTAAMRILAAVQGAGWQFRMTSDADDTLVIESALAR